MYYIHDEKTKKFYSEDVLAKVTAVDPFHWDTDIQNKLNQIKDLQASIAALTAEKDEFYAAAQAADPAIEKPVTPTKPTPVEEPAEETPIEEPVETPVEETPVE